MPEKQEKEGVQSGRKIPSTAATQFPDIIDRPFWSLKDSASASDDFFDCYVAFKELGCHEYFWEWKDRKLDELLIKKLMDAYRPFFKDNQIGKSRFITFAVNNQDSLEAMGRLYMSIITANDYANNNRLHTPPVFEVAHSTKSSDTLSHFAGLYNETVSMAADGFKRDCNPKMIGIIPNHNFDTNWYAAINKYFSAYQSSFRKKIDLFRPLIPRARVADTKGFVGAVLATKRALSSYASFEKITGVTTLPIVDAAPLMFRGGLNPKDERHFIKTYPGTRTVTITPSFRYGYDLAEAKSSIESLHRLLPKNRAQVYTKDELTRITKIEKVFEKHFQKGMKSVPDLSDIADQTKNINRTVDKRLKKTFTLYSLGIPPELIGTGNAILECIKESLITDLELFYPTIKPDLRTAGSLLNRENLYFLSKSHKSWEALQKDIQLIEDYTDSALGPDSTEAFLHRNHTSNVFHLRSTKQDFSKDLQDAARLRHSLG